MTRDKENRIPIKGAEVMGYRPSRPAFWEMDFESLSAPPEDHSDRYSPTRQPRDRDECAAGPWDK